MDLQLNIAFNEFESRIYDYEDQLNALYKSYFNENSYEELINKGNDLNNEILTFLRTSFSKPENRFLKSYLKSISNNLKSDKSVQYTDQFESDYKRNLYSNVNSLTGIRKLVSLSDLLKDKKSDMKYRQSMSIPDIQDFVLEKLYTVFDGGYYSIQEILRLNGIPMNGSSFDSDLTFTLDRLGYIEKTGGARGYIVRLSSEGAKHIQELIKIKAQAASKKNNANSTSDDELDNTKRGLSLVISTDLEKAFDVLDIRIKKKQQSI